MIVTRFNTQRNLLKVIIASNRVITRPLLSKCNQQSTSPIKRIFHTTRKTIQPAKTLKNQSSIPINANTLSHHTNFNAIPEPTSQQLKIVALRAAIPMIGFGFMDNLVMISAGEMIDLSIGVTFGLSTLTAAGFGQCISDVVGFTSGGLVDALVTKLHIPSHGLSTAQMGLKRTRVFHTIGGSLGVLLGCLLGMTSLLFIDTSKADRMRKAKELHSIFRSVMDEGHDTVEAEKSTLWLYDPYNKEVWSRIYSSNEQNFIETRLPLHHASVIGTCVEEANTINVEGAYKGSQTTVCVPIFSKTDKNRDGTSPVIGVLQVTDKKNGGCFTDSDVKILKILSSHVAAFIHIVQEADIE